MNLKKISFFIVIFLITSKLFADTIKQNTDNHQLNYFVGNFDFSDHKQKAILFGFQLHIFIQV